MGKFLSAVLLALACVAHAGATPRQAGVRVGPEAEESKPNGGASKKEEKKEEKPAAGNKDARPSNSSTPNDAAKKEPQRAPQTPAAKPQTPAEVPSTAAAATAPVGSGATHATSDAPAKPGPVVGVPVNNPAPAANNAPAPATNGDAAKPANAANPNAANTNPAPTGAGATTPNTSAPTTSAPANTSAPVTTNTAAPAPTSAPAVPLTSVYRIGVGDILDIRLLNQPDSRLSTLYTVLAGGLIEYPLIRDHVAVAGLTPEELSAQLVAELRHRGIFERPQVRVSVREYASHAVLVSGLVSDPGTKIIRREAVPLYVVVAESQPKPEAGRAVVISHATGKTTSVDLLDAAGMNLLVQQGDVISLVPRPPEFFYVGGEIASPGQKSFHMGMTLTQAVLASGGVTAQAGAKIKVLRQGPDGRLVASEYDLKQIEGGVVPDPALQPGDRIEVSRAARK